MGKYFDNESNVKIWNIWLKIISVGATILGFIFIYFQLDQFYEQNQTLNKQTELLKQTLVQTYRPIGVVTYFPPDNSIDKYEYLQIEGKTNPKTMEGSGTIIFRPFLSNKGNGVLVYIGHLYFISETEYSFRDRLLKGLLNPNEVKFDWNYSRARQETLLPNETARRIAMRVDDIDLREKYYFYALILYEDQDGNLYDTEHMLYFETEKTFDHKNKRIDLKIKKEIHHDVYNSYSEGQKDKLLLFIQKRNHPMIEYFSISPPPSSEAIKK